MRVERDCFFGGAGRDVDVWMVQRNRSERPGIPLDNCSTLDGIKCARSECALAPRISQGNGERGKRLAETEQRAQSQRKNNGGPNPWPPRRKNPALLPDRKLGGFYGVENIFSQVFPVFELGETAAQRFGITGASGERFAVGVFELLREFFHDFFVAVWFERQGRKADAHELFPIMHSAPPRCD